MRINQATKESTLVAPNRTRIFLSLTLACLVSISSTLVSASSVAGIEEISLRKCEKIFKLAATGKVEKLLKSLSSLDAENTVCAPKQKGLFPQGLLSSTIEHSNPESAVALAKEYGINSEVIWYVSDSNIGNLGTRVARRSFMDSAYTVILLSRSIMEGGYPGSAKDSQLDYVKSASIGTPVKELVKYGLSSESALRPTNINRWFLEAFSGCMRNWGCRNYVGSEFYGTAMKQAFENGARLGGKGQGEIILCGQPDSDWNGTARIEIPLSHKELQVCNDVRDSYLSTFGADAFDVGSVMWLIKSDRQDIFDQVMGAGFDKFDEEMIIYENTARPDIMTVRQMASAVNGRYYLESIEKAEKKKNGLTQEEFIKLATSGLDDNVLQAFVDSRGIAFELDVTTIVGLSKVVDEKYIEMLQNSVR